MGQEGGEPAIIWKKSSWQGIEVKALVQGVFFTGPPLKKLKHGKLRLGEVRCV